MHAPIAFRSAQGRYSFIGTTQLINAFAEEQGPDGKGALSVLPSEGLVEFAENGDAPCRGLIFMEDLGYIYSIHNSGAYRVDENGTSLRIGTVPGIDTVQLSRNQAASPQILVKTQAGVQIISSDALSYLNDTDLPSDAISADVIKDYGVIGFEDRTFYLTGINDAATIDALDFATFEQKAGKLIRLIEHSGELVGMCSTWMEFWRDTGNADFPFEPLGFRPRGLKAANAVVKSNNTLIFPGDDNQVYRLDTYDPSPISTHEVTRLIENDASASSMIGFSFDRAGHAFSCFKGTDWSRCYDSKTQTWHSRETYGYTKWRAQHSVRAFGKTIVGDAFSGKLFYLDKDTYTEDGDTLIWKVISPPLHVFPNGAILDAVHFDLATGYGTLSGQGSDPKVMLRTSTDGGNTFTNYRELELGTTGDYKARVTARRLGRFGPKGIVFELSISDPVARALVNCDVELRPLKR